MHMKGAAMVTHDSSLTTLPGMHKYVRFDKGTRFRRACEVDPERVLHCRHLASQNQINFYCNCSSPMDVRHLTSTNIPQALVQVTVPRYENCSRDGVVIVRKSKNKT